MQTDNIRVRYVGLDMQKKINTKIAEDDKCFTEITKIEHFLVSLKVTISLDLFQKKI